jgi:hypothetical protein
MMDHGVFFLVCGFNVGSKGAIGLTSSIFGKHSIDQIIIFKLDS